MHIVSGAQQPLFVHVDQGPVTLAGMHSVQSNRAKQYFMTDLQLKWTVDTFLNPCPSLGGGMAPTLSSSEPDKSQHAVEGAQST